MGIFCRKKINLKKHVDGQIRLVHLVSLQTDNFRWFPCQQTDKQQTSICIMNKREIACTVPKAVWEIF